MALSIRHPKIPTLFVVLCLLTIFNPVIFASLAQAKESGCPVPPSPNWTSLEKQVWETLCSGRHARFSKTGNPNTSSITIRSQFLQEIVRDQKYGKAIVSRGVNILGAHIKDPLDLSYASIPYIVQLTDCEFADDVTLRGLRTDFPIVFAGSTFHGALDLSSMRVGEVLVLDRGTFNEITLLRAQIRDELLINGATFNKNAVMSSMKIGSSLLMRNSTFKGDVDLHASSIGHDLSLENSSSHGSLNLTFAQIHGNVHLGGKDPDSPAKRDSMTRYKKVDISRGEIQGDLNIVSTIIDDELRVTDAHVRSTLRIDWADLAPGKDVRIDFCDLGSLIIDHTNLPSLNMMATTINRRLSLGTVKWNANAKLTLRATEVNNLNDLEVFWPQQLEMREFVYKTTFSSDPESSDLNEALTSRSGEWLKSWLSKQAPYSPQPYKQLASVLQSSGYKEKANEILFENKERELSSTTGIWNWTSLAFYRFISGYGIYPLYYAWIWTCVFVLGGCLLLYCSQNPFKKPHSSAPASFVPGFIERIVPGSWIPSVNQFAIIFIYSLDRFLPGVRLQEHIEPHILPTGKVWYWFQFQQVMGYVVAVFLIAGLSGLVEK